MRRSTLLFFFLASCSTSPAAQSPLREQLAAADTSKIEEVARACLAKFGWKVDPIGGLAAGGWNVIHASKAKGEAKQAIDVYVQPPGGRPRVTGGPDYDDKFWTCLKKEIAPAADPLAPLGAP